MMSYPFEIVATLDLETAAKLGSQRNDLLPPRAEDEVGGELSKRFSQGLADRLQRGGFDPTPASVVYVPKPGHTTRPAALLSLDDRVVYEALVAFLRKRIESYLLGPNIVCWPRGLLEHKKQWTEFVKSPLKPDVTHIAVTDLTGYYESIEHDRLRDVLIYATGYRNEVAALMAFLGRVMGSRKGLPQGLQQSDQLATVFLTPLDASIVRAHVNYARHGDDFRIGATSYALAQSAIHLMERHVRELGLLLNGPKTAIVRRETYESQLLERDKHIDSTRRALFSTAVDGLVDAEEDVVVELIQEADKEELGWAFFYHQNVTFDELVEELRNQLEPTDINVANTVFISAMNDVGKDELAPDEFHQRITFALLRLTAARSPAALERCAELVLRYEDKTELVVHYLRSMTESNAEQVRLAVNEILTDNGHFLTPWTKAWLFNLLERCHLDANDPLVDYATGIAQDESEAWIGRLAATRILGNVGRLTQDFAFRIWNLAPPAYHTDLAVAVESMNSEPWAAAFLDSLQGDVFDVVRRHLRDQSNT